MNVDGPTHIWLLIGTSFASLTRNDSKYTLKLAQTLTWVGKRELKNETGLFFLWTRQNSNCGESKDGWKYSYLKSSLNKTVIWESCRKDYFFGSDFPNLFIFFHTSYWNFKLWQRRRKSDKSYHRSFSDNLVLPRNCQNSKSNQSSFARKEDLDRRFPLRLGSINFRGYIFVGSIELSSVMRFLWLKNSINEYLLLINSI